MIMNYIISPGIDRVQMPNKQDFINAFCEIAQIELSELISKKRDRPIVQLRMMLTVLILKNYRMITLTAVGQMFDRDHATIIHHKRTVKNLLEVDPDFRRHYESIVKDLKLKIGKEIIL